MQTVIVTGAGKGIGRAIALMMAQKGYKVIANYRSDVSDIESLQAEAAEFAANIVGFKADVSVEAECQALVDAAFAEHGRLDVVVNNAGITRDGLLFRMTEANYDDVMDANAKSVFLMTKHAAKRMLKQRSGSIINMSSVSGVMGNAGQINYAASKAAIIGMTKTAARELAGAGIRVNAIAPGFITTRMSEAIGDAIKEKVMAEIPMKTFGKVEDIANAVCFLASAEAAYITGVCLAVDGGMSM